MKKEKITKAEQRRRKKVKKDGGFYFNYDYDEAIKRGKTGVRKSFMERGFERKHRGGIDPEKMAQFEPQKMRRRMKNANTKKWEYVEMDQCCAAKVGTDPPARCKKPAISGTTLCRSHGGHMIEMNREANLYRYSDEELREQIQKIAKGDLLNIKEEIAITILVLRKHLESMMKNNKDMLARDIELFVKVVDSVTKQVERLHKMQYGKDVVTKDKLNEMLIKRTEREIKIIEHLVKDEKLKVQLFNELANIQEEVN